MQEAAPSKAEKGGAARDTVQLSLLSPSVVQNGNPVSGNAGQFNYKTLRQGDELRAWWWLGPWCLEKTEHVETAVFPFGQEGIDAARAWLEEAFNAIPRDTIEAKSAFLDSEPWTPPAPEEEKDEDAPPF